MAVGFRRRLTALTVPKASSLLRRTRHKKLSYSRVRCNSLPGRFHPVVARLHESTKALIGWTEEPAQVFSPTRVADGAARLLDEHLLLCRCDAARLAAALRAKRCADRLPRKGQCPRQL